MEKLRNEVFNYYSKNDKLPQCIKMNKDYLIRLKETGQIDISAIDPSKRVFLGIEIIQDNRVVNYEIC